MNRLNRQEAMAAGLPTCYGSLCKKHPEAGGLRRVSGACVECAKHALRNNRALNAERTKKQRRKDYIKLVANPEAVAKKRSRDVEYRQKNRERCRKTIAEWSAKNPEKVKAYAIRTKQKNKSKLHAYTVKRRLAKKYRTPAWLTPDDFWMIEQAYELAALRTKMFGFQWHVDHIVPLQGKIVSGLHVPTNLRVIPWVENVRKANKLLTVT